MRPLSCFLRPPATVRYREAVMCSTLLAALVSCSDAAAPEGPPPSSDLPASAPATYEAFVSAAASAVCEPQPSCCGAGSKPRGLADCTREVIAVVRAGTYPPAGDAVYFPDRAKLCLERLRGVACLSVLEGESNPLPADCDFVVAKPTDGRRLDGGSCQRRQDCRASTPLLHVICAGDTCRETEIRGDLPRGTEGEPCRTSTHGECAEGLDLTCDEGCQDGCEKVCRRPLEAGAETKTSGACRSGNARRMGAPGRLVCLPLVSLGCVPEETPTALATCVVEGDRKECRFNADCAEGTRCEPTYSVLGTCCVPLARGKGALGDPCVTASDCASGMCTETDYGGPIPNRCNAVCQTSAECPPAFGAGCFFGSAELGSDNYKACYP